MHVNVTDAVIKGILIGLFMAISVGPTLFAVIKYSMTNSYKAGLAFVFGVSLSDILYVTIANLAASWLLVLDSYRDYIAYVGSAILIIVGLVGLLSKAKPKDINDAPATITGGHYFRIWASGFIINTVNPGVIISWLTAVSATANSSGPYRFILFATCLILILAIDFLKVFLAGRIRLLLTPQRVVYVQKASSLILGGLGVLLLAKTFFGKK